MARSFSIGELVQLPTLDAASAVTLVKRLLTLAGQHKKLPAAVDKARKRLETGHAELAAALSDRLTVTSGDPRRSQAADQAEDLALSALYDFLTAYSKLPESAPESARFRNSWRCRTRRNRRPCRPAGRNRSAWSGC